MSARAAWRLESLGFHQVFRYEGGKEDWLAHGLPREGALALTPRAADAARADVPTCRPADSLDDVRARLDAAGWHTCIVVNDAGVVLGRVGKDGLGVATGRTVEDVMDPGPLTIRPNTLLSAVVEHLGHAKIDDLLVTTSDGVLIGLLRREDGERHLRAIAAQDGKQTNKQRNQPALQQATR